MGVKENKSKKRKLKNKNNEKKKKIKLQKPDEPKETIDDENEEVKVEKQTEVNVNENENIEVKVDEISSDVDLSMDSEDEDDKIKEEDANLTNADLSIVSEKQNEVNDSGNEKLEATVEEDLSDVDLSIDSEVEDDKLKKDENSTDDDLSIESETDGTKVRGYVEDDIKFPKEFKMSHFRVKLRTNDFILELRHFLHLVKKNGKYITKYFEKKGKPLELVEAFGRIDNTHLYHMSYICEAFQLILMDILVNKKEHTVNAINASRYFLKSHGYVIQKLLKSPCLPHRKIILKLLTSIVCLEPELGRQILSCFDFLINSVTANKFLSHNIEEKDEDETIRKTFIHFILSYLVDGNIILIRNILDNVELLQVLIGGLFMDDHVTVCVVLNTIKKYIVENPDVLKTKKIHLFDYYCVKHLIRLYDWLGPKAIGKNDAYSIVKTEKEIEYTNIVRENVHEFLILLLSTRKFGLAFDSMTNFKQKRNLLQKKVMISLKMPWADKLKTNLLLTVLKECPDIARSIVKHYGPLINPEKTGKAYYATIAKFLTKIISNLNPSILDKALDKITLNEYTFWIKDICLSAEILVNLKSERVLLSDSFETRYYSSKLILAMFQQFCNYMFAILNREKYKGSDLRRFKLDLMNYIFVNFPSMEWILMSTYKTIAETEKSEITNKYRLQHLDVILDIVLLVATHHRSYFNRTGLVVDYIKVFEPIFASEELGTKNIKMEIKVIKAILLLTPLKLTPRQTLFEKVLNVFTNVFIHGEKDMQKEAGDILRGVFLNTHFFEENQMLEIDIWLQAMKFFDFSTVEVITFLLYGCFQIPYTEVHEELVEFFKESDTKNQIFENTENLRDLFKKIESDETVEGYLESLSLSTILPYLCLKVEFQGEENAQFAEFINLTSLLLFYYFPNSLEVYKIYTHHLQKYKKYMKMIIKKNKIQSIPQLSTIPYYDEVNEAIYNGKMNFFEIFEDKTQNGLLRFFECEKEYILNEILQDERQVLLYIYSTIFLTMHLTVTDSFEQKHVKSSHQFLKNFLKCIYTLESGNAKTFKGIIFGDKDMQFTTDISHFKNILKYIYCNHADITQNFNIFIENESKQNFLIFLCEITDFLYDTISDEINEFLINLQQKIVLQIIVEIKKTIKNQNKPKSLLISKILNSFRLSNEQCSEILKHISQLKYNDFIYDDNQQEKSVYYEIFIFVLNRFTELKQSFYDENVCENISKIYIDLISNENLEINLEKLEESLYNFLTVSHQCIHLLPNEMFQQFFNYKKLTKNAIKLATLLLDRNSKLQSVFLDNLKENLTKKELIYPLLNILVKQNKYCDINEKLYKEIFDEFKNGFMKTIEKPQKSGVIYKENVEVSINLVNELLSINECVNFTKKTIKTDSVEIFQLKLINAIYRKAIKSVDLNSDDYKFIFVNFLNNCIQLYNIIFKRDNLDEQKSDYLNYIIFMWIKLYYNQDNEEKNSIDFNHITNSQHWNFFYKNCLKYGFQITDEILINRKNSSYLKILAYLCNLIFGKNDSENSEIIQIYELILSHSNFSDIVYNKVQNPIKTQIFNLLLVLAQKNPKVVKETHIPTFLGAYHAKLSDCDRYILALIQYYESNGIRLYEFRPFIWGDTAITHYSLTKIEAAALEKRESSIEQMMSLIDRYASDFTVQNFPIWRKLNTLKQLPQQTFEDPEYLASHLGTNIIEKYIEYEIFSTTNLKKDDENINKSNFIQIDNSLLKLCPKKDQIHENCYDPAFIIPLMCMSFSSEVNTHAVRPVQNGLLSIVFAAISSQDKEMRLAAGCCQLRYREHVESKKFFDQALWIQAYDNIQNGLEKLKNDWIKHKKHGIPKVPYISGLFLIKAINLLIEPTNPLYKTMVMYLRLKESFNFLCVPEFNVLFHSTEVNHLIFQQFILNVIKDGIKSSSDISILLSNNIFKAIMGFYFSVMTNLELNLQILSIISICAKIPASSKLLIDFVGILPWLNGVVEQLEYYKFDSIEGVISIINNLWFSIKIQEKNFYNFKYIESVLYKLLVKLSPFISSRISLNNFARYLNILQKTAGENHKALKEENLDRLLLCAQKHFEKDVWKILNIKKYGAAGVETKECFLRSLQYDNVNEFGQLALLNLREFVIKWT